MTIVNQFDPDAQPFDCAGPSASCDARPFHKNETIPDGIQWSDEYANFYDENDKGMGEQFYQKWYPRRREFPPREAANAAPSTEVKPETGGQDKHEALAQFSARLDLIIAEYTEATKKMATDVNDQVERAILRGVDPSVCVALILQHQKKMEELTDELQNIV